MKNGGKVYIPGIVLWMTCCLLFSQNQDNLHLEILDNLSEEDIEQIQDQADVLEFLQYLAAHPMDLNSIDRQDLERLHFLNPAEIKAIFDYRSEYGPFIDLYELQVVEGLSLEKIQRLLPFLTVEKATSNYRDGEGYVLLRSSGYFPLRNGYRSGDENAPAYLGGPLSMLIKYRQYQSRNYSWGGSLEKDQGERFDFQRKPGFDHLHIHYYKTGRTGKIKTLALGDYRLSLGQGLIQYHGFAISKSSNPLMIKRMGSVIQPYSGTSEYYYFRGAAVEIEATPHIQNFIFLHRKKRDATLRTNPQNGEPYFSAFQSSGLHRTINEESKRNQVAETMAGHRIQWQNELWTIGLNSIYQRFSMPYRPVSRIDNLHRLTGSQVISHSIDFSGYVRSLHIFGELATQNYHSPAFTVTGLYSFHPRLDGGLLIRRFPAYFAPVYGNAFSARSLPNNESGVYLGLNYYISSLSSLAFYIDSWKGLWPTFQSHGPSFDQDLFLRFDISRRREWEAYAQVKFKHRANNQRNYFPVYNTITYDNQLNLRLQFRKIHYQHWHWTNRWEISRLQPEEEAPEYGFLAYTDLLWSPIGSWWSLAGRLAYFNTHSYSTRIYAFEPDILYSFSIPSFYGQGWRVAGRISRKWRMGLRMELHTGWTFLPGEKEVGSGHNAVPGSFSQQIKVQAMYEF